jgi:hypothetical protein
MQVDWYGPTIGAAEAASEPGAELLALAPAAS